VIIQEYEQRSIQLHNWLGLYHTLGVGTVKFHNYLQADPLLQTLPARIQPNWSQVERDLNWLERTPNAHILTLADADYPAILKKTAYPPPILFVVGDVACLNEPQIAMVGSRTPTTVGIKNAYHFAQCFAKLGFTITSGLAVGIDGMSHRGALSIASGKTIAVLGHGMDMIYPLQHTDLAEQIVSNGCLVTEFGFGTPTHASFFPRRNRIISGMSLGVLVVEAAINSGSLITARYAAEQGRDVFTIPGSIHSPKAKGCHELIKQGAKLVESAEEVLEELASLLKYVIRDKTGSDRATKLGVVNLTQLQQQVLDSIDEVTTCLDIIVGRSNVAVSVVGAILLELELQGLVHSVPGGYTRKLD
jgi:DNA processing protein